MKRATVAVARKLAVMMHCIWGSSEEFDFGGPAVAAKAAKPIPQRGGFRPFVGTRASGKVAPTPDLPSLATEQRGSTLADL